MACRTGIFIILLVFVLVSGCTQTGKIVNTSSVLTSSQPDIDANPSNETGKPAVAVHAADPCSGIECKDSAVLCRDGYISRCGNTCSSGACTECKPDCTGHDIVQHVETKEEQEECQEEWVCSEWDECMDGSQARACKDLNECSGDKTLSRDCECSSDSHCNDGNQCTTDSCDVNDGSCLYNEISPCCGNGICESGQKNAESHGSCPEDCEERQGRVVLFEVAYDTYEPRKENDEWLVLFNPSGESVDLTGWKIEDNANDWPLPNTTLDPEEYMLITKNATVFEEYFGCKPDFDGLKLRLNNEGDQLTLWDVHSQKADFVAWEGGYEGMESEWMIEAGEGESIRRSEISDAASPGDWEIKEATCS